MTWTWPSVIFFMFERWVIISLQTSSITSERVFYLTALLFPDIFWCQLGEFCWFLSTALIFHETQVPRRAWDRSPYWSGWGRWWTDAIEGSLTKCNWVKLGIWVFPKIGVPQNGWFIVENPIKSGWFGGTTIFGNTHMFCWYKETVRMFDVRVLQEHVLLVHQFQVTKKDLFLLAQCLILAEKNGPFGWVLND